MTSPWLLHVSPPAISYLRGDRVFVTNVTSEHIYMVDFSRLVTNLLEGVLFLRFLRMFEGSPSQASEGEWIGMLQCV